MISKMFNQFSRRKFLGAAGATTLLSSGPRLGVYASSLNNRPSDGYQLPSAKGASSTCMCTSIRKNQITLKIS